MFELPRLRTAVGQPKRRGKRAARCIHVSYTEQPTAQPTARRMPCVPALPAEARQPPPPAPQQPPAQPPAQALDQQPAEEEYTVEELMEGVTGAEDVSGEASMRPQQQADVD